MALWVGKERALKPFLQLFITLDQKVCLIPELRFPIATLLNKKKVIFLPPVDLQVPTAVWCNTVCSSPRRLCHLLLVNFVRQLPDSYTTFVQVARRS